MKERSDEELLDSLYGERADRLDDGAKRGELDDDLELDQLRRLRGVFAELKASQEEPPPAGMALLMAAARQAAEERKPKQEGLWARLRAGWQTMVAHPAMAAATAAVVVIGASGYLMSRGVKTAESTYSTNEAAGSRHLDEKSGAMEPTRASSAPAAPAPAAAEPVAPAVQEASGSPSTKLEMATGTASATAPSDSDGERERRRGPALKKAKAPVRTIEEAPAGGLVEGGSSGGASNDKNSRLDDSYSKQNTGAVVGSGGGGPAERGRPTTAPPPPPPPPPAAQAPVQAAPEPSSESADESAGERDRAGASKDEAKKPSGVESLTQKSERWYQLARDAAAKGDCNAVRLLAQRVQAENPGFYEKRFKTDTSLKKCL